MIAALYVETNGVYFNLPNVDPWDKERDARKYDGPHVVIAHPPCERWGSFWYGGPLLAKQGKRKEKGDDGGCFAAALDSVRKWGGILEHPANSHAWRAFELNAPPRSGGWITADFLGGWTCCVEQGHYGHFAPKATWLYACGVIPVALKWGTSQAAGRISGSHRESRKSANCICRKRCDCQNHAAGLVSNHCFVHNWNPLPWPGCKAEEHGRRRTPDHVRRATPIPFRDLLISIAESAERKAA